MSYLKINSDVHLGDVELNRLVKFLDQDGFRKILVENSISFGLIHKDIEDGVWSNFRIEQGTNAGTIKNSEGVAINNEGQLIRRIATDNIALTDNNSWYWIKIAHAYDSKEVGVVTIDRNGNLTGDSDCAFLDVLRGIPNNPVKVKFSGSTLNTGEYEVTEVTDDQNAVLSGVFQAETELRLIVVGAFTPDVVVPTQSKEIFQYDGCTMTLVLETVSNTPPAITEGEEFLIARVRRNGSTITIEDKRALNVFRTKVDFDLHNLTSTANALIGVEAVKYNHNNTPRDKNIVYVGWGMRSSNWTVNSSTNTVTILGGLGGKFKDTGDFTDGDFDGWRLYAKDGSYKIIRQSTVAALQINLVLDSLDPDDFSDTTQELHIVPNCEQIEIIAETDANSELPEQRVTFPINLGYGKLYLVVYDDPTCQYTIKYRYKSFKTYTQEALIPDDAANGYLVESAFDIDGDLDNNTRQTYANGIITLTLASNAYSSRIAAIETGDLLGVEYLAIDSDIDPILDFIVGQRKKYVIITNDDDLDASDSDFGTQYILTDDVYINLRSDEPTTGLESGNEFIIQIRGDYGFGGFGMRIVQDYVSGANPGIDLYGITQSDLDQAAVDNLVFRCLWDGSRWIVHRVNGPVTTTNLVVNSITSDKLGFTVVQSPDNTQLYTKVVEIGDWDMDANQEVTVDVGVDFKKIRSASVMIRSDSDAIYRDLMFVSTATGVCNGSMSSLTTGTSVVIGRTIGGAFDSTSYDSTSFNRGWITIHYIP